MPETRNGRGALAAGGLAAILAMQPAPDLERDHPVVQALAPHAERLLLALVGLVVLVAAGVLATRRRDVS